MNLPPYSHLRSEANAGSIDSRYHSPLSPLQQLYHNQQQADVELSRNYQPPPLERSRSDSSGSARQQFVSENFHVDSPFLTHNIVYQNQPQGMPSNIQYESELQSRQYQQQQFSPKRKDLPNIPNRGTSLSIRSPPQPDTPKRVVYQDSVYVTENILNQMSIQDDLDIESPFQYEKSKSQSIMKSEFSFSNVSAITASNTIDESYDSDTVMEVTSNMELYPKSSHPVRRALDHILKKAGQAVSSDGAGDYPDALAFYHETIDGINRVMTKIDSMLSGFDVPVVDILAELALVGYATNERIPSIIPPEVVDEIISKIAAGAERVDYYGQQKSILLKPSKPSMQKLHVLKRKLIEIRSSYIERVDILLLHIPSDVSFSYNNTSISEANLVQYPQNRSNTSGSKATHSGALQLLEMLNSNQLITAIPPEQPPPPARFQDHKVFWQMRVMARTMVNPEGGLLTPGLYLPKTIWSQSLIPTTISSASPMSPQTNLIGPKLAAIDIKISTLEELLRCLRTFDAQHSTAIIALLRWSTPIMKSIFDAKLNLVQSNQLGQVIRMTFTSPPPIAMNLDAVLRDLEEVDSLCIDLRGLLVKKLKFLDDIATLHSSTRSLSEISLPGSEIRANGGGTRRSSVSSSSITGNRDSGNRLRSWGSRVSKSVERLSKVSSLTQALSGTERSVMLDELNRYIELLVAVFGIAQSLEHWMNHFENIEGIYSVVMSRGPIEVAVGLNTSGWEQLHLQAANGVVRIRKILLFFTNTMNIYLVKDLELLWERYSKRAKK
ncbi:hypothetical protein HK096_008111, partial [Nowakowskiella sp. JEL0078]